jgi:hypothetical protein
MAGRAGIAAVDYSYIKLFNQFAWWLPVFTYADISSVKIRETGMASTKSGSGWNKEWSDPATEGRTFLERKSFCT